MIILTEKEIKILNALAKYKFLTNSQLVTLKIGHIQRVRQATKKLAEYPTKKNAFIGSLRFPVSNRFGRLENIHFLTLEGAKTLIEIDDRDLSELNFVKIATVFYNDYWHRKFCIDFQISLTQEIENNLSNVLELPIFERYFDKTGANRTKNDNIGRLRAITRADFDGENYIIPDANFIIQKKDNPNVQALFCLEMTNGKDTKRVLRQLEKHKKAMQQGIIPEKYNLKVNHKTLFLFSEKSLMKAVMNRFFEIENIKNFQNFFFFGFIDDVINNVFNYWRLIGNKSFFNFLSGKEC
jgi:hypothetical protein